MQRYIFPATYTIVNVIFLVTFNYFNAFSLGKGHFFAPSRLYNGPAYAQNRYDEKLSVHKVLSPRAYETRVHVKRRKGRKYLEVSEIILIFATDSR